MPTDRDIWTRYHKPNPSQFRFGVPAKPRLLSAMFQETRNNLVLMERVLGGTSRDAQGNAIPFNGDPLGGGGLWSFAGDIINIGILMVYRATTASPYLHIVPLRSKAEIDIFQSLRRKLHEHNFTAKQLALSPEEYDMYLENGSSSLATRLELTMPERRMLGPRWPKWRSGRFPGSTWEDDFLSLPLFEVQQSFTRWSTRQLFKWCWSSGFVVPLKYSARALPTPPALMQAAAHINRLNNNVILKSLSKAINHNFKQWSHDKPGIVPRPEPFRPKNKAAVHSMGDLGWSRQPIVMPHSVPNGNWLFEDILPQQVGRTLNIPQDMNCIHRGNVRDLAGYRADRETVKSGKYTKIFRNIFVGRHSQRLSAFLGWHPDSPLNYTQAGFFGPKSVVFVPTVDRLLRNRSGDNQLYLYPVLLNKHINGAVEQYESIQANSRLDGAPSRSVRRPVTSGRWTTTARVSA